MTEKMVFEFDLPTPAELGPAFCTKQFRDVRGNMIVVQGWSISAFLERSRLWSNTDMAEYLVESLAVQAWCRAHNSHYYARETHEFLASEALREAFEKNAVLVLMEDLS